MNVRLCFATNNAHKVAEVAALLPAGIELVSLQAIGCHEELPETTDTIAGNARQKATYVRDHYGVPCFADDSGLEVAALGGAPGVHSAYYAGPARDSQQNLALVLSQLTGQADRRAQFRTVVALAMQGQVFEFEGIAKGTLLTAPRGAGGFGYDPIFLPNGHARTFAEMTNHEKGAISHRGRAIAQLLAHLTSGVPFAPPTT